MIRVANIVVCIVMLLGVILSFALNLTGTRYSFDFIIALPVFSIYQYICLVLVILVVFLAEEMCLPG